MKTWIDLGISTSLAEFYRPDRMALIVYDMQTLYILPSQVLSESSASPRIVADDKSEDRTFTCDGTSTGRQWHGDASTGSVRSR